MCGSVNDVNMHANFGEDRSKDFGVARGRVLAFSIDLLRRTYNTLALPCECVITRAAANELFSTRVHVRVPKRVLEYS